MRLVQRAIGLVVCEPAVHLTVQWVRPLGPVFPFVFNASGVLQIKATAHRFQSPSSLLIGIRVRTLTARADVGS